MALLYGGLKIILYTSRPFSPYTSTVFLAPFSRTFHFALSTPYPPFFTSITSFLHCLRINISQRFFCTVSGAPRHTSPGAWRSSSATALSHNCKVSTTAPAIASPLQPAPAHRQTQCSSNSYASMSRYVSPWNLTAVGTCPEGGGGKGAAGCTMSEKLARSYLTRARTSHSREKGLPNVSLMLAKAVRCGAT